MRHDKIKMRLLGVAALLLAVAVILLVYFFGILPKDSGQSDKGLGKKETIHLWYTDDALTDYLANKALEFYDRTDIRVEVKLVSGLEYLEAINKASIDRDGDAPDLYILSNDSLEKAYLAGLATELSDTSSVYDASLFNQAAQNAVTYDGKYVGCPLYFETSALLSDSKVALSKLEDVTEKAQHFEPGEAQAVYYRDEVTTAMAALRAPIDRLEMIVDKEMWPMPSYGDLLFEVSAI